MRLEQLVGYNLKRASALDMIGSAIAVEAQGLRIVPLSVLLTIVDHPGLSSADICRQLKMQRANIVPILAELERRQLIERQAAETDNRVQRLFCTREGKETAETALARIAEHEVHLLRRLSIRERATLVRLLALVWREGEEEEKEP